MLRNLLNVALFAAVGTATAALIAQLVGGPSVNRNCAGDECEANLGPATAFLFLGLPAGIGVGLIAVMLLGWFRGR